MISETAREHIPDQYKWNLKDLYPTDESWAEAKQRLLDALPGVEKHKGALCRSARQLLDCLETASNLRREYARLHSYASMSSDQDTRDTRYLALQQEIAHVGSQLAAHLSFIEPEVLAVGPETVERFLLEEPGLGIYSHNLHDILRRRAHTGDEGEERIIAEAGLMADNAVDAYVIFSNADFPYPELTLSDGKSVRLDKAAYELHRRSPNREDRKQVFAALFGALHQYRRTFGVQLYGNIKKDMFYARAHNYASTLESALDANNIPPAVYHRLVEGVNARLASFHRYLDLRRRLLGLDELHYYDLYAPLVPEADLSYTVEEARRHITASLAPLGEGYTEVIRKAFANRWLDFYPTPGKRSGAYSNGSAYDVHPYMLLNYNGKYDDMSTLAHELGHTMHSYLSNRTQPYATADYSIFVAEVASTFNEALLHDYMLRSIRDPKARLSLLGTYLESIKGTVFRQTQFAEFELRIHQAAERGEALTGDTLDAQYDEITKKYYGHERGVCTVDGEIRSEWSYIPHFYYNFYVYQYATSFTASAALSEQVLAGDGEATKRYLDFLAAGGSDYPIELLKRAGVDMTTSGPLELALQKMNRVMDEIEQLAKSP